MRKYQLLITMAVLGLVIHNDLSAAGVDGEYYLYGAVCKPSLPSDMSTADISGNITVSGSSISGKAVIREYNQPDKNYIITNGSVGTAQANSYGPVSIDLGLGAGNPIVTPTVTSAIFSCTMKNGKDSWTYRGIIRVTDYSYAYAGSSPISIKTQYMTGSIFNTTKKYKGQIHATNYFPWL